MDSNSESQDKHNQYISELREQDRWLPINNVARLMKNTLPVTTKVSKDAKECMQECVSEFISFVTSEASDRCAADKRKTINGEDILISLHALGFENYAEVLKIYLAKYRQQQAFKNQILFQRRGDDGETDLNDMTPTDIGAQSVNQLSAEKLNDKNSNLQQGSSPEYEQNNGSHKNERESADRRHSNKEQEDQEKGNAKSDQFVNQKGSLCL
ncbi:Hap3p Ecym_6191 [Eremothecium cymbalariae DBVPG|uniref:Transcription factor CBF/NF-Y/archaeal histone domain-containing protein n=1 Tax=Eremothecium cymbalariae (strain CBS 270.75 / DBVPG 7215 / KCTC 17166 / NRRL Y-17582) TaxID=931890 RepID=G8JV95_ERECY|nr:hypothetical protein Ecym_6191 [Eremothecium cymbalariae DBVPG\